MRVIFIAIILLLPAIFFTDILRGQVDVDCYDKIIRHIGSRDTVEVATDDGRTIAGINPTLIPASSLLYLKPVSGNIASTVATIPLSRIRNITYTKSSPARWGLVLLGFGVGAGAGAAIGVALAPEPSGWLDFPELECGFIGGVFGGMIGAAFGDKIGKRFQSRVTRSCD